MNIHVKIIKKIQIKAITLDDKVELHEIPLVLEDDCK